MNNVNMDGKIVVGQCLQFLQQLFHPYSTMDYQMVKEGVGWLGGKEKRSAQDKGEKWRYKKGKKLY